MNKKGYTLIELLVVISIITVLSTAVSVSVIQYREKSKIAKATAEVSKIHQAVSLLYNDTGKLPNGCIKDFLIEEEANLNTKKAGLLEKPDIENLNSSCEWTEDDLSGWSGPYFQNSGTLENSLLDSWGNAYYMDFDYYGYSGNSAGGDIGPGCAEKFPDGKEKIHNGIAIVSMGPDKKQYTCDDIVNYVKDCDTQNLSTCLN